MQSNKIGIPDELKTVKQRHEFATTLHWEKSKKVKTKSKGPKSVLLCTTILGVTKSKPDIYKLYDFTKGGTDIVDQRISSY